MFDLYKEYWKQIFMYSASIFIWSLLFKIWWCFTCIIFEVL